MAEASLSPTQLSNFDLKFQSVDLITGNDASKSTPLGLRELEAIRVGEAPVPASKHGLEVICGASCETGAQ
jgi:hypothetical protein